MDSVKVISECGRSDLTKVFDENVEEGADKGKGIQRVDLRGENEYITSMRENNSEVEHRNVRDPCWT
jgi:hypothetical protein